MKVSTRIVLGFAVLVALAVGPLLYQVSAIYKMQSVNRQLASIEFPAAAAALEMSRAYAREIEEYSKKYFEIGDEIYGKLIDEVSREYSDRLKVLQTTVKNQKDLAEVDRLTRAWEKYLEAHAEAKKSVQTIETGYLPIPLSDAISHLQAQTETTYEIIRLSTRNQVNEAVQIGALAERVSLVTGGISLLLAGLVAAVIVNAIGKPLQSLTHTTRLIAKGGTACPTKAKTSFPIWRATSTRCPKSSANWTR
jgi:hypothetical protein